MRARQRRVLPARRGPVRRLGLRRGQGRLPLRHRGEPRPEDRLHRVRAGAAEQRQPPPDDLQPLQPGDLTGLGKLPAGAAVDLLLVLCAEDRPVLADVHRRGLLGTIKFKDVLRNYDANARHPEVAGPGHLNDPDYLGPELGMTDEEFRTQMTLWSVAAAPLVIGSDVRKLSKTSLGILSDPDVRRRSTRTAAGVQAIRVGPAGTTETWVKRLAERRPCRRAAQPRRQPGDPHHEGVLGRVVRGSVHPQERLDRPGHRERGHHQCRRPGPRRGPVPGRPGHGQAGCPPCRRGPAAGDAGR